MKQKLDFDKHCMILYQIKVGKSDKCIPYQFPNGIMYNHVLHGYIVLKTSLRMATQNAIAKIVIKKKSANL